MSIVAIVISVLWIAFFGLCELIDTKDLIPTDTQTAGSEVVIHESETETSLIIDASETELTTESPESESEISEITESKSNSSVIQESEIEVKESQEKEPENKNSQEESSKNDSSKQTSEKPEKQTESEKPSSQKNETSSEKKTLKRKVPINLLLKKRQPVIKTHLIPPHMYGLMIPVINITPKKLVATWMRHIR